MKPIIYEAAMADALKRGIDIEAIYAKDVKPRIGEGPMSRLDCLRYDPQARAFINMQMHGVPEALATESSTVVAESQAIYNFWRFGKKMFTVSEDLSRMLMESELKVPKFFLKLPFPCIYIRFDATQLLDIECVFDDSAIPLDGVFVFDLMEDFTIGKLMQDPKVTTEILTNPAYKVEGHHREPVRKIVAVSRDGGVKSMNINFAAIPWAHSDDTIIDQEFITNANGKMWDQYLEVYPQDKGKPSTHDKVWIEQLVPAIHLTFATLAYINSSGADIKGKKAPAQEVQERLAKEQGMSSPPKKLFKKARELSNIDYYHVGGSIKLPHWGSGPKPQLEVKREGAYRTYKYKFQVRAHFRGYWKNLENLTEEEKLPHVLRKVEGNKALINKFIQAFWKGPEFSEVVTRPYMLDLPKGEKQEE